MYWLCSQDGKQSFLSRARVMLFFVLVVDGVEVSVCKREEHTHIIYIAHDVLVLVAHECRVLQQQ